jgi:hypothetical protein
MTGTAVAVIVVLVLLVLTASVRILKQYERGVQFRLGRVKDGERGPGLIFLIPLVDRVSRVSLRIVTMPIQSQGIITRDNVSVDVSPVAYFRVVDAVRSVVAIENVAAAIDQIAQTTLRAVVGRHTLDDTLSDDGRDRRGQELHDRVPGAVDEHDRRARHLPESRDDRGGRAVRRARLVRAVQWRRTHPRLNRAGASIARRAGGRHLRSRRDQPRRGAAHGGRLPGIAPAAARRRRRREGAPGAAAAVSVVGEITPELVERFAVGGRARAGCPR